MVWTYLKGENFGEKWRNFGQATNKFSPLRYAISYLLALTGLRRFLIQRVHSLQSFLYRVIRAKRRKTRTHQNEACLPTCCFSMSIANKSWVTTLVLLLLISQGRLRNCGKLNLIRRWVKTCKFCYTVSFQSFWVLCHITWTGTLYQGTSPRQNRNSYIHLRHETALLNIMEFKVFFHSFYHRNYP